MLFCIDILFHLCITGLYILYLLLWNYASAVFDISGSRRSRCESSLNLSEGLYTAREHQLLTIGGWTDYSSVCTLSVSMAYK